MRKNSLETVGWLAVPVGRMASWLICSAAVVAYIATLHRLNLWSLHDLFARLLFVAQKGIMNAYLHIYARILQ